MRILKPINIAFSEKKGSGFSSYKEAKRVLKELENRVQSLQSELDIWKDGLQIASDESVRILSAENVKGGKRSVTFFVGGKKVSSSKDNYNKPPDVQDKPFRISRLDKEELSRKLGILAAVRDSMERADSSIASVQSSDILDQRQKDALMKGFKSAKREAVKTQGETKKILDDLYKGYVPNFFEVITSEVSKNIIKDLEAESFKHSRVISFLKNPTAVEFHHYIEMFNVSKENEKGENGFDKLIVILTCAAASRKGGTYLSNGKVAVRVTTKWREPEDLTKSLDQADNVEGVLNIIKRVVKFYSIGYKVSLNAKALEEKDIPISRWTKEKYITKSEISPASSEIVVKIHPNRDEKTTIARILQDMLWIIKAKYPTMSLTYDYVKATRLLKLNLITSKFTQNETRWVDTTIEDLKTTFKIDNDQAREIRKSFINTLIDVQAIKPDDSKADIKTKRKRARGIAQPAWKTGQDPKKRVAKRKETTPAKTTTVRRKRESLNNLPSNIQDLLK